MIRSNNGVTLTEQGCIFLKFCENVSQEYERYLAEKNTAKEILNYSGEIELVVSPLLLQVYYEAITSRIARCFPKLKVQLIEADVFAAFDLIQESPDILGLTIMPRDVLDDIAKELICHELYTCPLVFCAAKNSTYFKDKINEAVAEIPFENMIAIVGAKQNSFIPAGRKFDAYVTDLDIVHKRLLNDAHLYVSIPQLIAVKYFAATMIGIFQQNNDEQAVIVFLYDSHALTSEKEKLLMRLEQELTEMLLQ